MGGLFSSSKAKKQARRKLENESSPQPSDGAVRDQRTSQNGDVSHVIRDQSCNNTPSPKSRRHHPYDEITEEDLENNRMTRTPAKEPERDSAISGTVVGTSNSNKTEVGRVRADDVAHKNLEADDPYTKVNKPKKSTKVDLSPDAAQPSLNYIEVEIVPAAATSGQNRPKPETSAEGAAMTVGDTPLPKRQQSSSPCNYTEIVNMNGQLVILSD